MGYLRERVSVAASITDVGCEVVATCWRAVLGVPLGKRQGSCSANSFPPMLGFLFLQGMVMDHGHFILIGVRDGKSLTICIDLMRLKLEKGPVRGNVGNRPQ